MEIKPLTKVSASFLPCLRIIYPFFLLVVFALLNWLRYDSSYQQALFAVFSHPQSPQAHLELAALFASFSHFDVAARELTLAQDLVFKDSSQNIAGASSGFEELKATLYPKEKLENDIVLWEKSVFEQPSYRDAHLHLALDHFRLGEDLKAQDHFQIARRLDPNYPAVRAVGNLLGVQDF